MKKCIRITIRVLLILIAAIVMAGVITVICLTHKEDADNVRDGVILLPTATEDTGSVVNKCLSMGTGQYDSADGKCSAVVKKLSNGDTVVGRNFDMTQSQYPIYIGRTDIEGFYSTVYAANLETLGPTYDSCIEDGVPKYMRAAVPFIATDSLNSEGLYMEMDMRVNQKDEDGRFVFSCSGTNPASSVRLNACELPSYVTMRCRNTDEAVALIKTLDIYTTCDEESWTLCFMIADEAGDYGLLELGCDEVRWLPGQSIQTNYYISDDFNAMQKYKMGLGRYDYIEKNSEQVDSEEDMLKLMEGVRYSEIYNIDSPNYDIRSEFAGDEEYLTNEYLEDDNNWADFLEAYRAEAERYHSMSKDEKEEAGEYWISLYTTVANCSEKTLSLSFSEEYDISYVLSFHDQKDKGNQEQ